VKRKVDVTLLGHRFTVRTERDEAWVQRLAANLSRRLEDARRTMRSASREEQILFVALGLADELFEEMERGASARADIRRHTEAMIGKLSAALNGGESAAQLNAIVDVEDESDEVAQVVQRQA
jgi:cell division protein ZapA (FtsZ GTPase activity inhibitor)